MYKPAGGEHRHGDGVGGADTSQGSRQPAARQTSKWVRSGWVSAGRLGPVGRAGQMGLDQVGRGSPYNIHHGEV